MSTSIWTSIADEEKRSRLPLKLELHQVAPGAFRNADHGVNCVDGRWTKEGLPGVFDNYAALRNAFITWESV